MQAGLVELGEADTHMFFDINEFDVAGFFQTAEEHQITPPTTAKHLLLMTTLWASSIAGGSCGTGRG